jgi:hypothetical protein
MNKPDPLCQLFLRFGSFFKSCRLSKNKIVEMRSELWHSRIGVNLRELMYMIEVYPSQLDNYIVNNTLHVKICKAWGEQADQQCLAACHTIVE